MGQISITSAHGKRGRVTQFEGYSDRAEEKMYSQLIKVLKLHYERRRRRASK